MNVQNYWIYYHNNFLVDFLLMITILVTHQNDDKFASVIGFDFSKAPC